jgi:hypothetical protein
MILSRSKPSITKIDLTSNSTKNSFTTIKGPKNILVSKYGGDFTSVKAACDYIRTQTHDWDNPWIVEVDPIGNIPFQESAFILPAGTTIIGRYAITNTNNYTNLVPKIQITPDPITNICLTVESSEVTLMNLWLIADTTPTLSGTVTLLKPASYLYAKNCMFDATWGDDSQYDLTLISLDTARDVSFDDCSFYGYVKATHTISCLDVNNPSTSCGVRITACEFSPSFNDDNCPVYHIRQTGPSTRLNIMRTIFASPSSSPATYYQIYQTAGNAANFYAGNTYNPAYMSISTPMAMLGDTRKYITTVGNGSSRNITVTHNLNTRDAKVAVRQTSAPYTEIPIVSGAVILSGAFTTTNTYSLYFASIPTSGQYTVTVLG